ncbi:MAG: VCBS repeat-containing protein, partial [Acidobacteriota bacterium]
MQRLFPLLLIILVTFLVGCSPKAGSSGIETQAGSGAPTPGALTSSPTPSPEASRPSGPIQFTDVTEQAGIRFKHNSGAFGKKYLPETLGSGVAFLDYDNDGWQDMLLINSMSWPGHAGPKSYPALYHNQNGIFTDVTKEAGLAVEMYGLGCAVGDYDNDGFEDIYVTCLGANHLFRNLGTGKFQDVTAKAGVGDPGFSTSTAWFDYDKD